MPPETDPSVTQESLPELPSMKEIFSWATPHNLIILGVAVVILAIIVFAVISRIRRNRDIRQQREAEEALKTREKEDLAIATLRSKLDTELITELVIREGIRSAHRELLHNILTDFEQHQSWSGEIIDEKTVRATKNHILADWTPERRAEFCARFNTPLTVVCHPEEWENLMCEVGFDDPSPRVVGLYETANGMVIKVWSIAAYTIESWTRVLGVLAVTLDAPDISVKITDAETVSLELHDHDRRYIPRDTPAIGAAPGRSHSADAVE